MKAVLDPPMAPVEGEQLLGISPLRLETRDPVSHLDGLSVLLSALARDLANLL
jgi:hypothetical protein